MNYILEQSTVMEGVDGKPDHQVLLSIGQSFSPQRVIQGWKTWGPDRVPLYPQTLDW